MEIWNAANATNSSVIMYYANTNPSMLNFEGTPYEFQRVLLPEPTADCLANRVSEEDRCSSDTVLQVGKEVGSCDTNSLALKKYIISSLRESTFDQSEASRSPAYDIVKAMQISTLDMLNIMRRWLKEHENERYFGSREAVCSWVANNIEDLMSSMVPASYPREREDKAFYDQPLLYVSLFFGAIALVAVLVCFILIRRWRKRKVLVYAQPTFLYLILSGLILVSISAILHAIPPSTVSCVAIVWVSTLGYSLELIPLIVKVAAINRLFSQAKKMKRVKIEHKDLYKDVLGFMAIVTIYLTLWTAVDAPTRHSSLSLSKTTNGKGGNIVEVSYHCASSSRYWELVSVLSLIILLLIATVMAVQSRNVRSEFNESRSLAFMIYSHFLFAVLKLLIFFFGGKTIENWSVVAGIKSLLLGLDTLGSVCIYFVPKLINAKKTYKKYKPSAMSDYKESNLGSQAGDLWEENKSQRRSSENA